MTKQGKIYSNLLKQIDELPGLTVFVIDPPNQEPKVAGKIAKLTEEAGASAVAVGGSVGAQGKLLDETINEIKSNTSLPVILFPGNVATLSTRADAIYYLSMLNSTDPYYISGAQIAAAMPVKRLGLEVIPTSYVLIEPGRAVGWVGRAQLIPRNLPYLAGVTALGGQYMGAKLVILESGGGAESPVPKEMVSYTKELIDVPLLVAGGVRDEKYAYKTIKAGADIIHVGTAIEKTNGDLSKAKSKIEKICSAAKKAGKEKK